MTAVEALAPAKVNLTLHVTGHRADGYHLLDSLVVFAAVADRVRVAPGRGLTLALSGPMAAGLQADEDNLVLRAARFLGVTDAAITLEKHLPVAAGIGGGSSDAAATLRALAQLSGRVLPDPAATAALGADVPVCLDPRPRRMAGVGEVLADVPALPPLWLVLVNPGVAVPTAAVFRGLAGRTGRAMPARLPRWRGVAELAAFLRMMRNDLETPAEALAPVIGRVRGALAAQPGCLLARMSGSGATVFGLFADPLGAAAAAQALRRAEPGWWVADSALHIPQEV